jgi:hypothetical protein
MVYGAANLVCQKEQSINKQLYAQIELENSIATPSETERALLQSVCSLFIIEGAIFTWLNQRLAATKFRNPEDHIFI